MNTQEQEYDFLTYVFTEKIYYIDAVKSEWEITSSQKNLEANQEINTIQENQNQETGIKEEINKIKSDNSESQSEVVSDIDFAFFGKNRKNFLILIKETEHENLQEADNKLLTGILAAGQLSLNDVAIVNVSKTKASFLDIYKKLKPIWVISFGVDTKSLGVPHEFELYKPTKIKTITWIISHNFVALHSDKTKKASLWSALKELECYVS